MELMTKLGIGEGDLLICAYADLLALKQSQEGPGKANHILHSDGRDGF